jgi:hypothetical protein
MDEEGKLLGELVQDTANALGERLYELKVPVDIGMAALSMLLATSARVKGFSEHDAINRFATSVKQVYKHITIDEHPNH